MFAFRLARAKPRSSTAVMAVALAAITFAPSTGALAQSGIGRAANAATGQSLRDAVEQVQRDLADQQAQGTKAGSGEGSSGALGGFNAFPSGRLRSSHHDELREPPGSPNNYAWTTREASAFVTGVYSIPGTVLGGQMKVGILGGENWLSLKLRNSATDTLDTANGQFGKASNESSLFGANVLWSKGSSYALATIVGFWGETHLTDAIDFCGTPGPGTQCTARRYNFDTGGYVASLTGGHVFALSGRPDGLMLDIRGVATYTDHTGAGFLNFQGDFQKYWFSVGTLTGSATLFMNLPMSGSALLRPYVQGYVRQEIGYNNKLYFDFLDPAEVPNAAARHWDQAHTYGGVDLGVSYVKGNMTLGSSIYFDASSDEHTFGGRVGVSWKLN